MRVLVCGDRDWHDKEMIRQAISRIPRVSCVIEGEARGADLLAREVAEEMGIPVEKYVANWLEHGRSAGPIRNRRMILEGKPDLVLAFHDDLLKSRGTANMILQARKYKLPVYHYSHHGVRTV